MAGWRGGGQGSDSMPLESDVELGDCLPSVPLFSPVRGSLCSVEQRRGWGWGGGRFSEESRRAASTQQHNTSCWAHVQCCSASRPAGAGSLPAAGWTAGRPSNPTRSKCAVKIMVKILKQKVSADLFFSLSLTGLYVAVFRWSCSRRWRAVGGEGFQLAGVTVVIDRYGRQAGQPCLTGTAGAIHMCRTPQCGVAWRGVPRRYVLIIARIPSRRTRHLYVTMLATRCGPRLT